MICSHDRSKNITRRSILLLQYCSSGHLLQYCSSGHRSLPCKPSREPFDLAQARLLDSVHMISFHDRSKNIARTTSLILFEWTSAPYSQAQSRTIFYINSNSNSSSIPNFCLTLALAKSIRPKTSFAVALPRFTIIFA